VDVIHALLVAELCYVATPEFKCLFAMVNWIKYTTVANSVDYFRNVHKMSGPIKCTTYIEGDAPVLDLDHFVRARILREEPDHSLSMLYGCKVIRLPNLGLRLYSCESLTLQFDQMGEARHSFRGPPRTSRRAHMEAAQQTMTTPQAHPQESQWDTGYGGGYSGYHEGGSYYPSHSYPKPNL
jgi:hypothetical protein